MTTFFTVNTKFNDDARKAFFTELSKRLEYMTEDLNLETPEDDFNEMFDILTELRNQAMHVRVSKVSTPIKIDIKAGSEVNF